LHLIFTQVFLIMTHAFLSRLEVQALTGAKTRKSQIKVLAANGIQFFINAKGWPVLIWAAVEKKEERSVTAAWKPNFGVLGNGQKTTEKISISNAHGNASPYAKKRQSLVLP
jgi:Domain of unknown function (DUF4224)